MSRRLIALLVLLLPLAAGAANFTQTQSGDWEDPATWGGSGFPDESDTATLGNSMSVTLNGGLDFLATNLTWGQNSGLTCTEGASLTILDWTPALGGGEAGWFVSELNGDDDDDGTTSSYAEPTTTGPKQTWADGIGLGNVNDQVLFQKGGHYPPGATFDGEGKILGSYGVGSVGYGPRPVFNLGGTDTLTQIGAAGATQYHARYTCGSTLKVTPVMDRDTAVAPAGILFQFAIDHPDLTLYEPREWRANPGDTPEHVPGGEVWLLARTTCDFGDPGSGNWETGAFAGTPTPSPKNLMRKPNTQAHVYENPGLYIAICETRYGGQSVTNVIPIAITSPEAAWPGVKTWCFARDGLDWSGCPLDSDLDGTPCEAVDDAAVAGQCVVTDDFDVALKAANCNIEVDTPNRCLFRRGDTFESSTAVDIDDNLGPTLVSYFGDPAAADPLVQSIGSAHAIFELAGTDQFTIWGVDLTGTDTGTNVPAITGHTGGSPTTECQALGLRTQNTLFGKVDIRDFDIGYTFEVSTATPPQYRAECGHENLGWYDGTVLEAPGLGGKDVFAAASSGYFLGMRIGNRGSDDAGHEHNMRMKYAQNFVISECELGQTRATYANEGCGPNRHVLTIRNGLAAQIFSNAGYTEDELAKEYTQRVVLMNSILGVCDGNGTSIDFGPTDDTSPIELHHSYLVSGNLFTGQFSSSGASHHLLRAGGLDFLIENNGVDLECGSSGTCRGINVWNREGGSSVTETQRARVFNNTCWDSTTGEEATCIRVQSSDHYDTMVGNNLLFTEESGSTLLNDAGTNTIECNGGGSGCNVQVSSSPFIGSLSNPPTIPEMRLSGAYVDANDTGAEGVSDNGVIPTGRPAPGIDAFGNCRQASAYWEGLHEPGGVLCDLQREPKTNTINSQASVGVNVQRNEEWQSAMPWTNAMKLAKRWQRDSSGAVCGDASAGDYVGAHDDLGYPIGGLGGDFCIFTEIYNDTHAAQKWETGQWDLRFDGDATPALSGAASNLSGSCSGGVCSYTFDVDTTTGGIRVGFTAITSLSNLRVYPPGGICASSSIAPYGGFDPFSYCNTGGLSALEYDACSGEFAQCVTLEDAAENAGLLFHPLWMKRMQPYRGVRTMDWRTNSIADVTTPTTQAIRHARDWSPFGFYSWNYRARPLMPYGKTNSGTVPPEVHFQMCDMIGSECWFVVPHFATDAEITRLGELCRDLTDLECYFELSNETWNNFEQATDIDNLVATLYGDCPADGLGSCRSAWVGNRTGEMCTLLEAAFGETGEEGRMTCVLGTQMSSPGVTEDRLLCDCNDPSPGNGCGTGAPTCDFTHLDMLAGAMYFGTDGGDTIAGDCDQVSPATTDGLCSTGGANSMADDIANRITGGSDWITAQSDRLSSLGFGSVMIGAYEGGTGYSDAVSPSGYPGLCLAVQEDTCLTTQYTQALAGWRAHFDAPDSEDIGPFFTFNAHSVYNASTRSRASPFGNRGNWLGPPSAWPKENAIVTWGGGNCWWTDCALRASEPSTSPGGGGGGMGGGGGGSASRCEGDVNGDGRVSVRDVLDVNQTIFDLERHDITRDGEVDIADVLAVAGAMFSPEAACGL